MRITEVEAIMLRQPDALDSAIADGSQDALILRLHTDEGITGIGEVDSQPHVIKAIVDAPASHANATGLGALLVGMDPLEIDGVWDRLFAGSIYYGRRGAAVHALSGIEIALWDIAGKAAGKPIHQLLGQVRRDRVKAYASTLMPDTPAEAARVVDRHLSDGFGAVKLGWGPLGRDADSDVELVAASRAAGGDDFDLMIDVGMGWTEPEDAIGRVRRMEEHRPYWVEEPFFPDEYENYARLAEAVDVPIAAGGAAGVANHFQRLLGPGVEGGHAGRTRADGGGAWLRVGARGRARGRRCVLHAWSTGIIKAASLHVLAVMPEAEYFEDCVQTTELNERLVTTRFDLIDGCVEVPRGPGLGIEIDEDVLEECRVKEEG